MSEETEARALLCRELEAHGVGATEEIVAACIGAITVYHARAQLDRELLVRLATTVKWGRMPEIHEVLREVTEEVGAEAISRGIIAAMGAGDFARFSALLGAGADPDEAARDTGGTGRPMSRAQRDGRACVGCGGIEGVMPPAGDPMIVDDPIDPDREPNDPEKVRTFVELTRQIRSVKT